MYGTVTVQQFRPDSSSTRPVPVQLVIIIIVAIEFDLSVQTSPVPDVQFQQTSSRPVHSSVIELLLLIIIDRTVPWLAKTVN